MPFREEAISSGRTVSCSIRSKSRESALMSKIKKIRHTRRLTPQEQQTIDMLNMEITKMESDYSNKRITDRSGINRLWSQKSDIESRAVWYEIIELLPEVDPDTPIYVDEDDAFGKLKLKKGIRSKRADYRASDGALVF